MLAALLLAAALAIVAQGWRGGHSFTARAKALGARYSRVRMILAWAGGLYATYALTTQLALVALDRIEAMVALPPELATAAHALGLPGWVEGAALVPLAAGALIGGLAGVALLLVRRRLGRPPIGLSFRSVGAAQVPGERWAAAILALSAGISEELFFRLLLPLLVAIVTGSGLAGVAVGLAAFALQHRHQGRAGMAAVTLIGAALTLIYLGSGRLWLAMAAHVAIDLNALVLRPAILPGRPG